MGHAVLLNPVAVLKFEISLVRLAVMNKINFCFMATDSSGPEVNCCYVVSALMN